MAGFLGSFLHQIDPKGRIALPAQFRRGHEDEPFVLIRAPQGDSLSLYPDEAWSEVQAELKELARRQPGFRNQVLRVTANAVEVAPDKQGRILVPERLRESAGLDSEALVVGAITHVQIWDPTRFERCTSAEDAEFDRHLTSIFV